MELPSIKLGPKPRPWDFAAIVLAAIALAVAVANIGALGGPGTQISTGATLLFTLVQLALACICLLVLGKTAKEGTLWGNLAAVGGSLLAVSGVFLAAALWVAA